MTYEDAFIPFVTRHVIAVGMAIGMFFRANPTVWTEDAAGDRHHTAAARQHRGGGHRRDIARHHPARGAAAAWLGIRRGLLAFEPSA